MRDLTTQILDGTYPVGAKLASERTLAERYRVSRGVVREALSGLENQGLVTIEPGRGVFATDPVATNVWFVVDQALMRLGATPENLLEARALLEGQAAAAAAVDPDPRDIEQLRSLAEAIKNAPLLDRTVFDLAFHFKLASMSGNVIMEGLLQSLAPMMAQLMLRSLTDESVSTEGIPHHDNIIDALQARDPAGARHWIEEHMNNAHRSYGDDYRRPLEALAREATERLGVFGGAADLRDQLQALVLRARSLL